MAKRTPTGSAGRTLAWLAALLVVLAAILAALVSCVGLGLVQS